MLYINHLKFKQQRDCAAALKSLAGMHKIFCKTLAPPQKLLDLSTLSLYFILGWLTAHELYLAKRKFVVCGFVKPCC